MRSNADLTLYAQGVDASARAETWTRSQIRGVTWENRHAAPFSANGNVRANTVAVYIPLALYPASGIKPGDVIVRGLVTDTIGPAFTITALRAKYPESAAVTAVDKMDLGSLAIQHYQVEAN
jgi:hypothetical protein